MPGEGQEPGDGPAPGEGQMPGEDPMPGEQPEGEGQNPGEATPEEGQTPDKETVPGGAQNAAPEPDGEEPDSIVQAPGAGSADGTQTPDVGLAPDGTQTPEAGLDGTPAVGTDGIAVNGKIPQGEDAGIISAAEGYDTNKPVIESFEFVENGQELTAGDTLNFNISAYDADSGIQSVRVYVTPEDGGFGGDVSFTKEDGSNLYKGTLACDQLIGTRFYISSITVVDMVGNFTDGKVMDDNGQYLYTFTLNGNVCGDISISGIQMEINDADADGKVSVNDTVIYTVNFTCEGESIVDVDLYVNRCEGGVSGSLGMDKAYDADTQTATVTYTITDDTYPGIWELFQIYVTGGSGYGYSFDRSQMGEDANLKFTVSQTGEYDEEKPVIESITLDKNGETVEAGDTVTMRVKASDEHLSSRAFAQFIPIVVNVEAYITVELELDATTGEYIGSIEITEDTYPCEWDLEQLSVSDEAGNTAYLDEFEKDHYLTHPWYFRVMSDTYVENTIGVKFNFYGLRRDEYFCYDEVISSETVSNVGHRASLRELGVALPQPEEIDGLNFVGWKNGSITVDEDTQLIFNNTDTSGYNEIYNITAEYDKGYVNIWLNYRKQDGSNSYVQMVKFVEKDTTYREALDSLELPEDAYADGFTGFQFNGHYEEDACIGDSAFMGANATYDKGFVEVNLSYLTKDDLKNSANLKYFVEKEAIYKDVLDLLELPEDAQTEGFAGFQVKGADENTAVGEGAYFSVNAVYNSYQIECLTKHSDGDCNTVNHALNKTYPAGTKMGDILADLDRPEAVGGAEFEKWALLNSAISEEDEISLDMKSFTAVALYSGKTTVEANYEYRGEEGGKVYDSRMLLLDGENISSADIRAEGGKVAGGLKHLEGLTLAEWTNEISYEGQERYREIRFTAVYSDCVVTLWYPEGNEYVILGQGERFTLPIENEKYENMVWSGYSQGATVTVTGDMHFSLDSYEVKDTSMPDDAPAPDDSGNSGGGTDKPGVETPGDDSGDEETPGDNNGGDDSNDTETPGDDNAGDGSNDANQPGNSGAQDNANKGNDTDDRQDNHAGVGGNNANATGSAQGVRVPERVIAQVTAQLANVKNGETVNVDMKEATVVPKQILESARGKDVTVVLNMNGYKWVINGRDIAATELKEINLEVKMDVNAVPSSLVKTLAGDKPTRQLSLTHNGDFGFRADLVLNLGSENREKVGNLYYYDSTGKLVFMNAGNIADDGTTVLHFSHASDYVIVISDKAAAKAVETGSDSGEMKSPKTGE